MDTPWLALGSTFTEARTGSAPASWSAGRTSEPGAGSCRAASRYGEPATSALISGPGAGWVLLRAEPGDGSADYQAKAQMLEPDRTEADGLAMLRLARALGLANSRETVIPINQLTVTEAGVSAEGITRNNVGKLPAYRAGIGLTEIGFGGETGLTDVSGLYGATQGWGGCQRFTGAGVGLAPVSAAAPSVRPSALEPVRALRSAAACSRTCSSSASTRWRTPTCSARARRRSAASIG